MSSSIDIEMKTAIESHESKSSLVIPIIIRDCDWHSAPFGKLNPLPRDGKAVAGKSGKYGRDKAWKSVAEEIAIALKGSR